MKREIKFRAWDTVQEKMLPVEAINFREDLITLDEGDNSVSDTKEMFILMQYTGLKDRKGKEIYESHKVKFRKFTNEYTGVVCFEKGCFIVKWDSVVGAYGEKATHSEYLKNCEDIEIIGDLLEGRAEWKDTDSCMNLLLTKTATLKQFLRYHHLNVTEPQFQG